jgi:hypothetical protein
MAVPSEARRAKDGGEGGIRTPGTREGTTDFESVTFGHSATSPSEPGEDFFHAPEMASLSNPNLLFPDHTPLKSHFPCGSKDGEFHFLMFCVQFMRYTTRLPSAILLPRNRSLERTTHLKPYSDND